jgi:hypothetical protein
VPSKPEAESADMTRFYRTLRQVRQIRHDRIQLEVLGRVDLGDTAVDESRCVRFGDDAAHHDRHTTDSRFLETVEG